MRLVSFVFFGLAIVFGVAAAYFYAQRHQSRNSTPPESRWWPKSSRSSRLCLEMDLFHALYSVNEDTNMQTNLYSFDKTANCAIFSETGVICIFNTVFSPLCQESERAVQLWRVLWQPRHVALLLLHRPLPRLHRPPLHWRRPALCTAWQDTSLLRGGFLFPTSKR